MSSRSKLKDLIACILLQYPSPEDLSNSRLTKLIFLIDWKSCLVDGRKVSGIEWYFDHYGPYVEDVIELAKIDSDFNVMPVRGQSGSIKNVIGLSKGFCDVIELGEVSEYCVKFAIDLTAGKNYDEFIELVYSLYPVVTCPKYSDIDLVKKACEYKNLILDSD
ncbi:Panacea domain-containing protein [Pseudomonas sp. CFBP13528]|uniref:Panacea domain-containing protein n=1 Tax=Pseudomonas sp. CFBP13528 TaxID=2184006 RepID=UPI0010C0AA9F|nr:Panacea domain-containing protein [Pseudomonas sp. CFBP13528]